MSGIPRHVRALALALVGVVAGIGLVHLAPPAVHADDWCVFDPVVSINGQQMHILVGVEGASSDVANVVATTVVTVPAGVSASIMDLPTTGPFAETITFATSGVYSGSGPVPVKVQTTFTSLVKLNTSMQVTWPTGSTVVKYGNTNGVLNTVDVQFSE